MKRELAFSFAGHALMFGVAFVLTSTRVISDTRRPITLSITVVSSGSPLPKTETQGTTLVEAKPKSQAKAKSAAKPEDKPKSSSSVKRMGLGARIEGADALGYSYYLNAILARIAENWQDPYLGDPRKVTATVVFVIERDGLLRDIKVEKSSGDESYDLAAERALKVVRQLPPLPPEFKGPRLKLHLEFEHTP